LTVMDWKLTENEKIDDKEGMKPVRLWNKEMKETMIKTQY